MKKTTAYLKTLFFVILLTVSLGLLAQAPQGIQYQTVIRDGANLLKNETIQLKLSILEDGAFPAFYQETHTVATNDFGLVNLTIGQGTVNAGDFGTIDWGSHSYSLKVELDNGIGFLDMGTTQLVSVPYSLFAQKAEEVELSLNELTDVNSPAPSVGEVIKWDGTDWKPAPDNVSTGGGAVNTTARITGDGSIANPLDIAQQAAVTGEVLKWTGTTWAPGTDDVDDADSDPNNEIQTLSISGSDLSLSNGGGTVPLPTGPSYTAGTGINITGTNITNTGDTDASDDITTSTTAGGDLGGTFPNPSVEKLQGRDLASVAPTSGQVIKWNATTNRWEPANDVGGGAGDNWGTQVVQADATLSGTGVSGNELKLAPQGALSGEVLKWNGTSWTPALDAAGPVYTAGIGINITGTTISNTAPDQTVSLTGTGATGITGTYPNFTITSTDNVNDADSDPNNEIQGLSLSGSSLSLSNGGGTVTLPTGTTYSAGSGISISGSTISNTAPDQTVSLTGTGATGVTGTYPNFTITSTDNVNDADSDPNNEIQGLSLSGSSLSLSNGGGTVTLPTGTTYTAGSGISISGSTISNAAPDQTVSLTGTGATGVTGTYPNFTITSTDNVNDADSDPNNEIQGLSLSGSSLSLSNGGGTVTLPTGTTYSAGSGISISGSTISNTAPDQTVSLTGTGATGVTGTYPNFTITSTDNVNDADSDPNNEIQGLSLSGSSLSLSNGGGTVTLPTGTTYTAGSGISISGSTISNAAPDQTVSLTGSGATSVSGTYPSFTVSSTDNVNDADSNPTNEIQSLSLSGTNLSLSNSGGTISLAPFVSPWTTSGTNIYRTSGNIGVGTTSPVVAFQVYANRDILGGSSMSGNGSKLIWDYSSRAFRAGYAAASSWNEDSIGLYSAAFGFGSVAQAYMSFSHGFYTHARTYAGFSIGRYNVGATGNSTSWTTTDPLFEIGNGTSNTNRNNAFTIRKDGRVGINDATPDYLLDIENPGLSLRSIYINHDITSSSSTMYGVYVNADNTASNSGVSYAGYFDMTNNNDDAYGQYSLAFCDAIDGSPAYAVRSYVDNDNGSGWAYSIYGSVSGSTTGSKYAGYFNGNVYTTGSYLPSDRKLKKNISPAEFSLASLMNLKVKTYVYDQESYPHMNLPEGQRIGFLAEDVAVLMPELIKKSVQPAPTEEEVADGFPNGEDIEFDAVDYAGMVPYLVKAIQEQQEQIEALKERIEELEK